jgi:hypothetical protein
MKFFAIDTSTEYEYKLYDIKSGIVFFILKDKPLEIWEGSDYYTAQLFDYEPVAEELKEWLIEIIKNNSKAFLEDMSFNYNKVIKPMFRDNKLTQLGIT